MKSLKIVSFYIISLVIVAIGALISIRVTNFDEIIQSDAGPYLKLARSIVGSDNIVQTLFHPLQPRFIDVGYPIFLSTLMKIGGENNLLLFQVVNYLLWWGSCLFIYHALLLVSTQKKAFYFGILMALSPTFLTFSAKIYSEPLAAFGLSILIYSTIGLMSKKRIFRHIPLFILSGIIFSITKTVYVFFPIIGLVLFLIYKNLPGIIAGLVTVLLLLPFFNQSISGGRSNYNLAIQTSKVYQSYDSILACSVYYTSYPLGELLLPKYQGVCHQNNPSNVMPGFETNPYVVAQDVRQQGFGFSDAIKTVLRHPLKYFLAMSVSMFNIVFIEGLYVNVLFKINSPLREIAFLCFSVFYSFFLWNLFFKNKKIFYLSILPLIYFYVVVGNFPVEKRYFYPLFPWFYFFLGSKIYKNKKT